MRLTMIHDLPVQRGPAPAVRPFYWVWQLCGWGVFCGYVIFGYLYANDGQWTDKDLFNIVLFTLVICPIYSHGLRAWLWRRGWVEAPPVKLFPRLAALVAISAVLLTAMTGVSLFLLHGPPWMTAAQFGWMTLGYGWGFAGWLFIYFAVRSSRRHHEARAAMREAQLHALTAQLNPHFLFNCLNSVRALIAEDPARAGTMVTGLADLLRYALSSDRRHTVTLAEELAIVDEYLSLERVRLENRLRTEQAIAPQALSVGVPPMLVQTLVENAVKHGVAASSAGGFVHVRADVSGRRVEIAVTNSGAFKPADGQGRGLRNARERLRLIYGHTAALSVEATGDRTVASLSLPMDIAP